MQQLDHVLELGFFKEPTLLHSVGKKKFLMMFVPAQASLEFCTLSCRPRLS